MSTDCIFCKIVAGQLPANKVYEDDNLLAFEDIHPKAPVHLLLIPKKHFANLNALDETQHDLITQLTLALPKIAKTKGLDDFRVIINNGPGSGQIVFHLHYHILGGKTLAHF